MTKWDARMEQYLQIKKHNTSHKQKERQKLHDHVNKSKSWFLEKINKIDKPLSRLITKKKADPNKHNQK